MFLPFKTKDRVGGSLVDDDDWTDGSTAEQWPVMRVEDPGGADVTDQWEFDVSTITINPDFQVHPDTAKGLVREDSVGRYRFYIEPSTDLSLDEYPWDVTYDVNGNTFSEEHVINLVEAGDVDFGDSTFTSITPADVTANMVTDLAASFIETLITQEAERVEDKLRLSGVDVDSFVELPGIISTAIVYLTRRQVAMYDAAAKVYVTMRREGTRKERYSVSAKQLMETWKEDAEDDLQLYIDTKGDRNQPEFRHSRRERDDNLWDPLQLRRV